MNSYIQTWLDFTRMSLRFAQAWLDLLDREWVRLSTSPTTSDQAALRLVRSDEGSMPETGTEHGLRS